MTEETFGPTITVRRVASLEEGIRLANASGYGLGSSVFARNRRRAVGGRARTAQRDDRDQLGDRPSRWSRPCRSAGSGESGFGRIHGADGLREFARAKADRQPVDEAARQRDVTFGRTDADLKRTLGLITVLHGRRVARPLLSAAAFRPGPGRRGAGDDAGAGMTRGGGWLPAAVAGRERSQAGSDEPPRFIGPRMAAGSSSPD